MDHHNNKDIRIHKDKHNHKVLHNKDMALLKLPLIHQQQVQEFPHEDVQVQ